MHFPYKTIVLTSHFKAHLGLPSPLMDLHHYIIQILDALKGGIHLKVKGFQFLLDCLSFLSGNYFSFLSFLYHIYSPRM